MVCKLYRNIITNKPQTVRIHYSCCVQKDVIIQASTVQKLKNEFCTELRVKPSVISQRISAQNSGDDSEC